MIKKKNYIQYSLLQREKPCGFSLCFLWIIILPNLLFTSQTIAESDITNLQANTYKKNTTINTNKNATTQKLLNHILNGQFSHLPNKEKTHQIYQTEKKYAAIALIGKTIEAILNGSEEKCLQTINLAQKTIEQYTEDQYTCIFAYSSEAIIQTYTKSYMSSIFSYLSAYNELKSYLKNKKTIEPEIVQIAIMFNAIMQKIPNQYLKIMSLAGIKRLNLSETNILKNDGFPQLAKTIQTFKLSIIDEETELQQHTNSISIIILASQLLKNKQPKKALHLLNRIPSDRNQLTIHYYLKGQAHLNRGNYEKANQYFNQFLLSKEKGSYIKSSLLRKKWIAIIKKQQTDALTRAIEKSGTNYTFSDCQALKENKLIYNPHLLEARILYDGGQNNAALKVITLIQITNLTPSQQTSYYYQKARIFQALEQLHGALSIYSKLEKTPNTGHYYHKKAMLEKGRIYMLLNEHKQALHTLQMVSKIKSDMYKDAIDLEAEELTRIIHHSHPK